MHNFWRGVARFFVVISTIFFILSAVASLFLVAIDRHLLSAATYKSALSRQQIYARMPRVIAEQIVMSLNYNPCNANPLSCEGASPEFLACARGILNPERYTALTGGQAQATQDELTSLQPCLDKYPLKSSGANGLTGGGQPTFVKNLGVANWETVITNLFPPEALRRTSENLIDQVFAYLNGKQGDVVLNLSDLKNRIGGQAGLDSILEIIRAQPACTDQQLLQILMDFLNGSGGATLCRPPEEVLDRIKPAIQTQLDSYVRQMPDQLVLVSPQAGENTAAGGAPGTNNPVAAFRLVHLLLRLSPALALGFLLLVTLLAVRSPKSWLRWWGIPICLAGAFSILFALLAFGSFERAWLSLLAGRVPPSVSLGAITLGHDLARAVLQSLLVGILIGSTLLGLLGAVMWIGSAFIKASPGPQAAAVPPLATQ